MAKELQDKIHEMGTVFEEFKNAHTKELAEIKKKGFAAADISEKVDKFNDKITEVEKAVMDIKTALNRSGGAGGEGDQKNEDNYGKHFRAFLRKGTTGNVHSPEFKEAVKAEFKDLSVQIDEDGGFLVTSQMSGEIVKKINETSPIRGLASVMTISTDSLDILQDLDRPGARWVGETQSRSKTATPTWKMINIPVHEINAEPYATQKILDDAAINIESWLAEKVAEEFSLTENSAFVSGDGLMKPKGILAYASGTSFNQLERQETATNGVIDGDDLIDLMYLLKSGYLPGSNWAMNRQTEKVIRKLKADGRYLWEPGLNGGAPASVLGYGIVHFEDLAPMVNAAASNYSKEAVIFGNFRAGYQIVDRFGIRVLRDPYTNKPFTIFSTTKRVGGGVKNFEALKILKVKSA